MHKLTRSHIHENKQTHTDTLAHNLLWFVHACARTYTKTNTQTDTYTSTASGFASERGGKFTLIRTPHVSYDLSIFSFPSRAKVPFFSDLFQHVEVTLVHLVRAAAQKSTSGYSIWLRRIQFLMS